MQMGSGVPRANRRTIAEFLRHAQARLRRLTPAEAAARAASGWALVDTRDEIHRREEGIIPGAVHIPLSELPWAVDPSWGHQHPGLAGREDRLILFCRHGYSSSLAALWLHEIGFPETADIEGGFDAWSASGLPVSPGIG